MQPPSDAYTLNIRQGPLRAKVATPKDKDRKPVDPPPIIQLHIRDPCDPANNYLQSPHYFMCANLMTYEVDGPPKPVPQDALAGQICSSLHRLKDIDNQDGGFFVFADLSVKTEGRYRLRFSLFEMCERSVVYIKSIISDAFNVYPQKDFPGMTESSFLSRSFGDQGVKLRIRKEPRTLLKRQYAAVERSGGFNAGGFKGVQSYPQAPQPEPVSEAPTQPDYNRAHYSNAADYHSPSGKRQRTSMSSFSGREGCEYGPVQGPVSAFPLQHYKPSSLGQPYMPVQPSVPSSYSDHYYGHHARTNSSATSSPYVSPMELSGYPSVPGQTFQQYPGRDSHYSYPHPSPADHYRRVPQLAYPAPPIRQDPVTFPLRIEAPIATSQPAARSLTSLAQSHVYQSTPLPHGVEEAAVSSNEILQRVADRPILPPLHSTVGSTQAQGTAPQLQSINVLPRIDIEGHGSGPLARQSDPQEQQQTSEPRVSNTPSTS